MEGQLLRSYLSLFGKLPDFKRVLNFCRGSGIHCQLIVQSIPQLKDRYPKTEWEELIGCTDIQICLGCNDVDTATYISKKCGMVTIKVENNQMPLQPLFSPVYNSTRPYSQTKSSTQRALMLPDEILRMDNRESLVLLRGQKPLKLYKITPEEHPSFPRLRDVRVSDYIPEWRRREEDQAPSAAGDQLPGKQTVPPPKGNDQEEAVETQPVADHIPTGGAEEAAQDYEQSAEEACGFDEPQGVESPYGAFDLIEMLPDEVGGE